MVNVLVKQDPHAALIFDKSKSHTANDQRQPVHPQDEIRCEFPNAGSSLGVDWAAGQRSSGIRSGLLLQEWTQCSLPPSHKCSGYPLPCHRESVQPIGKTRFGIEITQSTLGMKKRLLFVFDSDPLGPSRPLRNRATSKLAWSEPISA